MHRGVRGLLVSCLLFAPACVENNVKVVQGTNLDAPLIAVEPGTLDYGGVALGSVATQALTIRNEGDADLTLSHLSIVGGGASYFALLEGLDDSVIAPGGCSEQQCMTMDWSATMLDAAGVSADPAYLLDGISLLPVLRDAGQRFDRPLHWRMKHRNQRALREGDWKYLRVDDNDYLFNLASDERERANLAPSQPERIARMRQDWEAWNCSMPEIPSDATVSLGYSEKDMPQR